MNELKGLSINDINDTEQYSFADDERDNKIFVELSDAEAERDIRGNAAIFWNQQLELKDLEVKALQTKNTELEEKYNKLLMDYNIVATKHLKQ